MNIRPFNPDTDYPAAVAVHNAIWPDQPINVAGLKDGDRRRDKRYFKARQIVEIDGTVVAIGKYEEPAWFYKPGKYLLDIAVHPNYRRRGIATAWVEYVRPHLAALEPVPEILIAQTREDNPGGLYLLKKHGFDCVQRLPYSCLDVTTFDADPFAATVERVRASGIRLLSLAEVAAFDSDWKRHAHQLEGELSADVPSPDPFTQPPFEQWEREILGSANFRPEGWLIALDGDDYVGMTCLWLDPASPTKLYTGLTGVKRSHRRQGIATALKVHSIQTFARAHNITEIDTGNEENNPMYQLNLMLGFQPIPALLMYQKTLTTEDTDDED